MLSGSWVENGEWGISKNQNRRIETSSEATADKKGNFIVRVCLVLGLFHLATKTKNFLSV